MHWITRRLDGTYACSLRVGDSTEDFIAPSQESAIHLMVEGAWIFNGAKITAKDIGFNEEMPGDGPGEPPLIVAVACPPDAPASPPARNPPPPIEDAGPAKGGGWRAGVRGLLMWAADRV
jgi:hypothetical protein